MLLRILFVLVIACGTVAAQSGKVTATPTPTPTPAQNTSVKSSANANADEAPSEGKKVWTQFAVARLSFKLCAQLPDSNPTCTDYREAYSKALGDLLKSSDAMAIATTEMTREYESMRGGARSAPQVSQAADEFNTEMLRLLVAQNQVIIELLTKLANKK